MSLQVLLESLRLQQLGDGELNLLLRAIVEEKLIRDKKNPYDVKAFILVGRFRVEKVVRSDTIVHDLKTRVAAEGYDIDGFHHVGPSASCKWETVDGYPVADEAPVASYIDLENAPHSVYFRVLPLSPLS